jgi:hypothetical protein
MTTSFWANDPLIIFNKKYIYEVYPTPNMNYERKINSITRLVIIITGLGYLFTQSKKLVLMCIATLLIIFFLYKTRKHKIISEGFRDDVFVKKTGDAKFITNPETLETFLKSEFNDVTKKNPFGNVLMTDIMDEPNRKAAPPSFNVDVDEEITKNVKKAVQFLNPGIKNTNKQLFSDLSDNFDLDQSNRAFFSTANTRVANDQGAFANYLYSDLKYSSKESTAEGSIARVKDSYRYTLY